MEGAGVGFLAIPEALTLGLIAAGTGRRLCRRLLPDASDLEASVLGFPAGMALLSILMTALLFARLPPVALPFVVGSALIGAAAWCRREAVDLVCDLRDFARESPVLAGILAASALAGVVGCLAPETGFDSGVYHFAMAKMRAERGEMVVRLDLQQWYRPAYLESLHSVGFLLNGEALASLINGLFYFAGLALARLWGIRLAGERGGTFVALAWLSSVTFVLRMNGGDNEVGQAVYLGVALLALLRLREGGGPGWRLVAGAALGIFMGMKYASIYAVAVIAATWLVLRLRDRAPLRALAADGAVIGLLSVLIACPWYVRNKLETGGFFYPFQGNSADVWIGTEQSESGAGGAALRMLAGDAFILAGVAALAVPALSRDRWTGIVAVLMSALMLRRMGWTAAGVTNALRYASPTWVALLVLGGAGAARAPGRWCGRLAPAALIAAAALGQGVLLWRNVPKVPVALGLVSRDEYLAQRVNTYRAIREAEAGLPSGKRILLVEERVYYCRAPFLEAADALTRVDFDRMASAEDLRRFLREESIGAIVVDRSPTAKTWKFRALERRLGADWPLPEFRLVTVPGDASLYRGE
jgi:hypothetical protein